jgi:hypothetical protein
VRGTHRELGWAVPNQTLLLVFLLYYQLLRNTKETREKLLKE